MQKYIDTITTAFQGTLIPLSGASVSVQLAGTDTLAAIYSDNGVSAAANPITSSATGLIEFYAADGRYDLVVTKAGYSPFTVADILLEDPANDVISALPNVVITGSTINSTTIGATAASTGRFTSVALASGATGDIALGEIRLNSAEATLDVGLGAGVVGQMFEETFITSKNSTGSTVTSGQIVGFAGVDPATSTPLLRLVDAGEDYDPALTIGVVTQTIASGSTGRVTTFGKVRSLDTTGAAVGETWAVGDLLYTHPTMLGRLTKVRPTVPYTAVVVAAVLVVHASDGVLLVRPQIKDHLHYGVFSSSVDQTVPTALTPQVVTYNSTDTASGVSLVSGTRVTPLRAGLYNFQFSIQLAKSSASVGYAWIWPRVSGVDVANSATKVSIAGSGSEVVPSWNFVLPMSNTDYFELVWAADSTSVYLDAVSAETFCPAIPSVILTVAQVNQ